MSCRISYNNILYVNILITITIVLCILHPMHCTYNVGVGKWDATGPSAEVNFLGYAVPEQTGHGIQSRLYARAFIIADRRSSSKNDSIEHSYRDNDGGYGKRIVYVSVDSCMVSIIQKKRVIDALKKDHGDLYTYENVIISAIHTHSGPGGFLQYVLFDITSLGFNKQSLDAVVNGVVKAISRAHKNLRPANILSNEGELLDSNVNRSPSAYLLNPEKERAQYPYNVDKNMTLFKIEDTDGVEMGMFNFFAVHCTSMNNTNLLISGDNKAYASYLFEISKNGNSRNNTFVAAFGQSNEGDVSPNTLGARCINSGERCDLISSTCNGRNELCIASGPGKDMKESMEIIGRKQYNEAVKLYNSAKVELSGDVDYRHSFVDMSKVVLPDGRKTCSPAMGYSFAAGTTDGPGMFDFHQNTTTTNIFWNLVSRAIKSPSSEQKKCHFPKPILIDTGELSEPYDWQPKILPIQIVRVGELVIIAVPAEFTTMSGRRLRNAVRKVLQDGKVITSNAKVVIAGLSNGYADYVATPEEYGQQRYEGGSTIFGPHTLDAYIYEFKRLAADMVSGKKSKSGPPPEDLASKQMSFLPPVIFDETPFGKHFGSVLTQPNSLYKRGDTVSVLFQSACPRNDLKTEESYLTVELKQSSNSWSIVRTDADFDTEFRWIRNSILSSESEALITWKISMTTSPGTYRIKHFGASLDFIDRKIIQFYGTSQEFVVSK